MEHLYKINSGGCWIWQRGTNGYGYGWYKRTYAHRLFYEIYKSKIAKGKQLHHKCHTRLCVNPDHLIQVTQAEHRQAHKEEQEFCKNGHPRTEANNYIAKDGSYRCRPCKRVWRKKEQDSVAAPVRAERLRIIEGVRRDFGKMPVKQIASKYGIGWRSVYRYLKADPKKLGYLR